MQSASYRLVGDSALSAVRSAITHVLSCWASEWGIDQLQISVEASRAWEAPGWAAAVLPDSIRWSRQVQSDKGCAWLALGAALTTHLQEVMFGNSAAPAVLAPAAANAAIDALLDAVCATVSAGARGAERVDVTSIPASVWQRGSGAVLVHFTVGSQTCCILLDCAAVQALQARPAALPALAAVDYPASLAQSPVVLELHLGSARVGLGSLLALAAGDVIGLSTCSDGPAMLRAPGGRAALGAYLGRCGDVIAVELAHSSDLTGASHV